MKKVIFISIVAALSLTACHNDGNRPWFNVYGQQCGNGVPQPGCDFYGDGKQIKENQDPFYSNHIQLTDQTWTYTDPYGNTRTYTGWGWESPDGIIYNAQGNALNSDEDASNSRDLIATEAQSEEQIVRAAGHDFAAKYGLAEATGIHVARTLNEWANLGRTRARTDADLSDFTQRLYGVNLDTAQSALLAAKNGDASGLKQANSQVAAYWNTTPETSQRILKDWYQDELSDYGAR